MSDDGVSAHSVALCRYDVNRIRAAARVCITQRSHFAHSLPGHDDVDRIGYDLAIRCDRSRAFLPPGHDLLELVVFQLEVDGVGDELEVLTQGMAIRRGNHFLEHAIRGKQIDHSAAQRKRSLSLADDGW